MNFKIENITNAKLFNAATNEEIMDITDSFSSCNAYMEFDDANKFEPEIGQVFFGQPYKWFPVPSIWEAALMMLRKELDRIMFNLYQKKYESPFSNAGNRFDECEEFIVEAYSWDEEINQPFNFKWRDVEISWYKYLGRGMSANKKLTVDDAAIMLDECLKALYEYESAKSSSENLAK